MLLPLFFTIKQRRDYKTRLFVKSYELPVYVDKALARNSLFKKYHKFCRYIKRNGLNSSRVKNICLWNGRSRGINYGGFSRHAIKYIGTRGRWLGFRKASW